MSAISVPSTAMERSGRSGVWTALFAAMLCALAGGAFEYLVISNGEDARFYINAEGLALFTLSRASALVLLAALLGFSLSRDLMARLWPIALVLVYFAITGLWSPVPGETASGLFRLLCAALPGVWVALAQNPAARMARLGQATIFLAALNLVAIILLPDLAYMRGLHEGALRGAFVHKNLLGICLTLVALVASARALDTGRLFWLGLAGIALWGIVLSQSSTALAIIAAALALMGILACLTPLMARWGLPMLVVGVLAMAASLTPFTPDLIASLSDLLGRDGSLSGRTGVWDFGLSQAQAGGMFGHGYQGFWSQVTSAGTNGFGQTWLPVHAHNGFLDAWLSGGVLGLIFVIGLFVVLWWRAIGALAANAPLGQRLFPLAAVFSLTLYNCLETVFPSGATIVPALVVALLGLGVANEQKERVQ